MMSLYSLNNWYHKKINKNLSIESDFMVSTILCPRCKTKNAKNAEICYNCKKPLKPSKKSSEKSAKESSNSSRRPLLSYFNRESINLKIIAIGLIIFILGNIIFLEIAEDYSVLISGFITLLFAYLAFKRFYEFDDIRDLEVKVLINYLIIAFIGILVLIAWYLV